MRSVPPDGGETQPIIRIVDVLPGAVRSEEAERLAALDVEVDAVDGDELAEALHRARGHARAAAAAAAFTILQPTPAARIARSFSRDAAAVAAGHPATTAAGIEILEDGGTARPTLPSLRRSRRASPRR